MPRPRPSHRPRGRRLRTLLLVCLAGLALLLALFVSPIGFPWALSLLAPPLGVHFQNYQRLGVSRVRLLNVETSWDAGRSRFQAAQLELPLPISWWRSIGASRRRTLLQPLGAVRDWSLQLEPQPTNTAPPAHDSLSSLLSATEPWHPRLAWLGGGFTAERGEVRYGTQTVAIASLRLDARALAITAAYQNLEAELALHGPTLGQWDTQMRLRPWNWNLQATAKHLGPNWVVAGNLTQEGGLLDLTATFEPDGWLPAQLRLEARSWTLPAPASPQPAPSGAQPPTPRPPSARLDGLATWNRGRGTVSCQFSPTTSDAAIMGSFEGSFQTTGDDLDALKRPLAFEVLATNLAIAAFQLPSLRLRGAFNGSRLALDTVHATTAEGATLEASGAFDTQTQSVINANWTFNGPIPEAPPSHTQPLPHVRITGSAQGAVTALTHQGTFRSLSPLTLPPLTPLGVEGRWNGVGLHLEDLSLQANTADASWHLRIQALIQPNAIPLVAGTLLACDFTTSGQPSLTLSQPSRFEWRTPEDQPPQTAGTLRLSPSHWAGPTGELRAQADVTWPSRGTFGLTLHRFTPSFAQPWLSQPPDWLPQIHIEQATANGEWNQGPLSASMDLDAALDAPELGPIQYRGSSRVTPEGIDLDASVLRGTNGTNPRLQAHWTAPIHLPSSLTNTTALLNHPLSASLTIDPSSWVWSWLAQKTGITWQSPSARLEASGTPAKPSLQLHATVDRLQVPLPLENAPPAEITGVRLETLASPGTPIRSTLNLAVQGQPVHAEATLPWPQTPPGNQASGTTWSLPDPKNLEGFLEVPPADLNALAQPLREILRPGGKLQARVDHHHGAWSGWAEVTQLTTQPLPTIGALRDIHLRVSGTHNALHIDQASLQLGEQPVRLSGSWALRDPAEVPSSVRLAADQVALVRSPDALIRADLDLTLTRSNAVSPPVVGGTVTLRDSVVMMDARDLVAVDLERPKQRPPYFSIDQDPVGSWELNVQVKGERFARVLSPILKASASADLGLKGTLRHPRLTGLAAVDRGRLAFPFGQLEVQQFRVLFTETDPYNPRLEGRAEGLSFGYNLGMDLGGSLANPEVLFTAMPPMSTTEVLQMLMAGTLPRNEYSYSTRGKVQNVGTYLTGDLLTQLTGDPTEEPRLSFRSAERVSSSGNLTYSVEYRLSDRWSAVGEYDRWNQIGAGVRWRVLEK